MRQEKAKRPHIAIILPNISFCLLKKSGCGREVNTSAGDCICSLPPSLCVEMLTPKLMLLGGGAFGK